MTKQQLDAEAVVRARMAEVGISQLRLSRIAGKSQSWTTNRFLPYIEKAAVALANSDPEALDRILVAHNRLVAGSNPARPTTSQTQ